MPTAFFIFGHQRFMSPPAASRQPPAPFVSLVLAIPAASLSFGASRLFEEVMMWLAMLRFGFRFPVITVVTFFIFIPFKFSRLALQQESCYSFHLRRQCLTRATDLPEVPREWSRMG